MTLISARRLDNLRRLIAHFGKRNLSRYEVADVLGIGRTSAAALVNELKAARIISAEGPRFRLIADAEQVAAFLTSADAAPCEPAPVAGRRFHILADDRAQPIRAHAGPVAADLHGLPVGFFGSGARA